MGRMNATGHMNKKGLSEYVSPESAGDKNASYYAKAVLRSVLPLRAVARLKSWKDELSFEGERVQKVRRAGMSASFDIKTTKDEDRILRVSGEEVFVNFISKTIRDLPRGSVLWDIGSAQGLYTILGASLGRRVVSVDPDPSMRDTLTSNIRLNGYSSRVTVVGKALGSKKGKINLHVDTADQHAARTTSFDQSTGHIEVEVTTIANLVKKGVLAPDIMKIDVEGDELNVLKGLGSIRPKHIFLELHRDSFLAGYGTSQEEVFSFIVKRLEYKPIKVWKRGGELLCHFKRAN